MPLEGLFNIEWLSLNSQRAYPLADDASGIDLTGSFKLPKDFLVELGLPVHAGLNIDPGKFYVRYISAFATGFSITVAYDGSEGIVNVASALIARQSHTKNQSYALGGVGDFADSFGRVVIGSLDAIDQEPQGRFELSFANGRLDTDAIRPMIRGLSSLRVRNGADLSQPIYGDVILTAGANIRLTTVIVGGEDPVIVIDAIEGEGLIEECVCEGDEVAPPIRRINNVAPTAAGDFTLGGDDCLSIEAIQNGLIIRDICSHPCCTCSDMEKVTDDLSRFGEQITTMINFQTRLTSSVTQFEQVVLGSKLNDTGCLSCE